MLHGDSAELDGVTFFGLGAGIPTTPWDWSFDLDDDAAAERLAGCPEDAVLILHSPPRGHCDRDSAGNELGSPAIAAAIERAQSARRRLRPHPRLVGLRERDRLHPGPQPGPQGHRAGPLTTG